MTARGIRPGRPPLVQTVAVAGPGDIEALILRFGLERHPEGGFFRRVFTHPTEQDGRPLASSILYLLAAGERSHWHRVDAVELWQFHSGAPLELSVSFEGGTVDAHLLGSDLADRMQVPQAAVPAGAWQSARSRGSFSFVSCTVVPAFTYDGFELAPHGWHPGRD